MEAVIHAKYVKQLKNRLKWSYGVAQLKNQKEAVRQKKYYDLKVRCTPLQVGDLVIPRQKSFRGKSKLQDRWDSTLYEVIEIPYPDMPVFKNRPQGDPEAKPRILHRNLLQPIRQVDTSEVEDQKASLSPNQENLDDSDLKDISKQVSDGKSDISAPVGPVTRSTLAGGVKLLSKCVQVATGAYNPLGELLSKPWKWWHSVAEDTE